MENPITRASSAQLYRLLFETNPQPAFLFDRATLAILAVSDAAAEHYGYARRELLGRPIGDLFLLEDLPVFLDQLRAIGGGGGDPGMRPLGMCRHRRRDGLLIDVEVSLGLLQVDGRDSVLALITDVTERRLAESTLWESAAQLRAIVESAPIVLWAIDRHGRFTLSEGKGLDALGLRPGEVVGRSVFEVYGDSPMVLEHVRRALAGESFTEPVSVGRLVFESHYAPLRGEGGSIAGVTGVATDITARLGAEARQSAVYRIAQKAAGASDMADLYAGIHAIVGELMPAGNFYIALYDEAADRLTFPYFVDKVDDAPAAKKPGRGLTEYVLRTGRALLASPDTFLELQRTGEVELIGAPSVDWLGVPLKRGERVFGVLVVQSYSGKVRFGAADLELLAFVSDQVAAVIHRRQAEQGALAERSFSGSLINSLPGVFYLFDDTLRFLRWNRMLEAVSGYSAAEIAALSPLDMFAGSDRTRIAESVRRVFETGGADVEASLVPKSGPPVPYHFVGRRIEFEGRLCCIGTGVGISDSRPVPLRS